MLRKAIINRKKKKNNTIRNKEQNYDKKGNSKKENKCPLDEKTEIGNRSIGINETMYWGTSPLLFIIGSKNKHEESTIITLCTS